MMPAVVRQILGESAKDHPLSDTAVVERVRRGDVALFEVLMRRHNRKLYRAVRSVLRNEDEIEDVMQQAYVSAFQHLDQFAERSSFSTWLIRIGVNEALARLRRDRRFVDDAGGDVVAERRSHERGPEARAADGELRRALEDAIDGLAPAYRTVFVLREIEDVSTEETADVLGLSVEAVKVRLHRARKQLRDALYARAGLASADVFPFDDPRCDRIVHAVFARIAAAPRRP
jgi:RNA polymerase sigma-70 factor (ECF subfamily)